MNDTLCGKLDILRKHLSDELNGNAEFDLEQISDYSNYCSSGDCNSELEKITVGFLWLLGQYFTQYPTKGKDTNSTKPFFLYIILWLSHKLNQIANKDFTKINEFYTKHVNNNNKYSKFINDSSTFTNLEEFINKENNLLNIDIEDLSKFYDASKLICNMYGNAKKNQTGETLSNDATSFVQKYTNLNNKYKTEGAPHLQILSALLTDYNNLNKECSNIPPFSDISSKISALASEDTSSSSIGNRLFTVLSIFGAIAFFLGISYKYSLFGFRKRAQKQYLREKIKNIKKKMNR
ncbi:PIR protein [Plasmodium yoelii]|uniref:PIR protein n=2 Tax=Plasmodium yoelii TaxID=5861 RepID=A0AAF0B055_PLAYO|nr:PIR protein [Plasmodium yoelii]WBY55138.1 PIR protein [Plasmodium yoelii yoelii]VTZ72739.1 PIR protein [Plasmodium yoelii]|eukprot:XP_022810684.1 PIR protein [Plasmodium yoelii]